MIWNRYGVSERRALLELARASIAHGLRRGCALEVQSSNYSVALREQRASFVTLKHEAHLRGCIGQLEADLPLVCGVVRNAYAAAFRDPRFPPLTGHELDGLRLSVSVLSRPRALRVADEEDLLSQLRPGEDGVILRDGERVATFLPAVWQSLPDPAEFIAGLKQKAGLASAHWSPSLEISIYRSETFAEESAADPGDPSA